MNQALAIAYKRLKESCLTPLQLKRLGDKRLTPKEIIAMKRNPYPLLIASINPRDSGIVKKFGKTFGVKNVLKAIDGFRRIHGPDAVLKPVVKNIKGMSGILIKRGSMERLDYDAGSVKGSKLSGATYFHKSGDRQFAKGKIKSDVYHTPNLKRTIILHANKYVNPEGMLDG